MTFLRALYQWTKDAFWFLLIAPFALLVIIPILAILWIDSALDDRDQ